MAIYRRLPSYGIACYSYEPRHVPGFFIWYAFYDFSRATSLAFSSARREWSDRGYLHANRSLLPCARKLCTRNGRRPCRGCEIDRPISSPPIRGTDPPPPSPPFSSFTSSINRARHSYTDLVPGHHRGRVIDNETASRYFPTKQIGERRKKSSLPPNLIY